MPEPPATRNDSNRRFYDRIARAYDLIADASEREARQRGLALLAPAPGDRVLEIGCGTGSGLIEIARLVGSSGRVSGIDNSSGMIEVASRKVAGGPLAAPIDLALGDARSLPFDDGRFDAVFASFTLELFAEEDQPIVIGEIRRVLKPGGRFGTVSMARPSVGEPESLIEQTYVWLHRHFPHIVDCRPIDPAAVLRVGGLELIAEERVDVWSMPVAAVVGVSPPSPASLSGGR